MLLVFKGKGCINCPFLEDKTHPSLGFTAAFCSLNNRRTVDGINFINLMPNFDEKPKDCPFAQFPNTLEIEAHDE